MAIVKPLESIVVHSLQARIAGLFLALFLVLGGLVPVVAQAQSCPSSAFVGGTISSGTRVRIVALSEADAYYSSRGGIVGKTGYVDRMDPTGGGGKGACWYGGQFYGDDGSSFYFYQVAVELTSASSGTGCPAGSYTGGSISSGTRVRILTVSSQDAYYGSRYDYGLEGGKIGRVDGTWSKTGEPCWFAGQFYGDDGSSFYFYQAAVELQTGYATSSCPGGAATVGMGAGTRVKILGLHPDDAYYGDAASMIGLMGSVSGDLHSNDGCWMGGGFTADNGTYYYFYKVAVQNMGTAYVPGASCPGGAATAGMGEGTRVKILGLHPDDAYYPSAGTMIGLTGVVSGDLHSNDGCWMGGGFTADNGTYYYFYKVAVQNMGTSYSTGTGCPAGSYTGVVPTSGTRVRILTVSSSDAYYSSRYDYGLEGKVGRVDPGWSKTGEPCWYAGQFYGDDGSSFYFYQAAIEVLGATTGTTDRYMGGSLSNGTRFRIVALHPDDAYYSSRATMIGKHCTATDVMPSQGSGWFSGPVRCTDGSESYFYKVGVVLE